MKNTDVMQKIILAAVEIVNSEGTGAVTTRRIGEAAHVNSAAMNYYFGSKEKLIEQVLSLTLSHLFSDLDMILAHSELSTSEKVFFLIDYLMEGISRYPGLTKSFLFDPTISAVTRGKFASKLEGVIDTLTGSVDIESASPCAGTRLQLGQSILSALSSSILPEMFKILTGGEITSEVSRRQFILPLVNGIPGMNLEITDSFLHRMDALREEAFKA